MTTVITHMAMSLDGFVAAPNDDPQELFEWYGAGDVEVRSANEAISFQVDAASAEVLTRFTTGTGALIAGRHLFDITNGWGDNHPIGAPVIVVTHRAPDDADRWPKTRFVDDVETAVATARKVAGDGVVSIASPQIAQQAIALGLVDEVWVSLIPVLFGTGKPYFADLGRHVRLEDPEVVQGTRALHLRYPVKRSAPHGLG
jgi:dihydrofolate reductase